MPWPNFISNLCPYQQIGFGIVLRFPKTQNGATMAENTKVTLEELVVSTLAMTDALFDRCSIG